MKITILTVGKIKEKYFTEAIKEYSKRLSRYCKLEIVEVSDEKTPDHASQRMEEQIRERESERLKKHIREDAYVFALAIDGVSRSSEEFADHIHKMGVRGVSHIVFIIGGSIGLSENILRDANEKISFSEMTFPHQLMRVILLEQIYRGFRIIHNEPYHK